MSNQRRGQGIGIAVVLLIALFAAASFSEEIFEYNEGELVRIVPEAFDEDGDPIVFVFSDPLNQSGEWQTTYSDAGTYTTTIAASDSASYSESTLTIVINGVNQPPILDADDIQAEETERAIATLSVTDPDGDDTTLTFTEPLDENGEWETTYGDAGTYTSTITASDGILTTKKDITITITKHNRPPFTKTTSPDGTTLTITETETVAFAVETTDPDGDAVTVTWYINGEEAGTGSTFTFAPDYESAGEQLIEAILSDGDETFPHHWIVTVTDKNRAPDISHLADIIVDENTLIQLDLPAQDADGNKLSYKITEPFDNTGQWTPSYSDAGTYEITITASDGELTGTKSITITVTNVNRPPTFGKVSDRTVAEGELLKIELEATDPDGDPIQYRVHGLQGATFNGNILEWTPGYGTVKRPKFIGKLLQLVRLDRKFLSQEKTFPVRIEACSNDSCTEQEITITVTNTNSAPQLTVPTGSITLNETDTLKLEPTATDSDGDRISFYYSEPLNKKGVWKTTFDDAGTYTATVGATDGIASTEKTITIIVNNVNHLPKFGRIRSPTIKENETTSFSVPVKDEDADELTLWAENMPRGATFDEGVFEWTPDYDAVPHANGSKKEEFVITFSVSDQSTPGSDTSTSTNDTIVKTTVPITVKDVNQAPVITTLEPVQEIDAITGQRIVFRADAFDPDGDELSYKWRLGILNTIKGPKAVARTFTHPGTKILTLTVSDGDDETQYEWVVHVGRPAVQPAPSQPVIQGAFVTTVIEG